MVEHFLLHRGRNESCIYNEMPGYNLLCIVNVNIVSLSLLNECQAVTDCLVTIIIYENRKSVRFTYYSTDK